MKYKLYYEALDWATYRKNFFKCDQRSFLEAFRSDFNSRNIFLTRAGRTGIVLSLKAFGLRREDEVLVPRFMSTCVLDSVNQVAMPSLDLSDRTKAVLFYHHWGYPQHYGKAQDIIKTRKLKVIEDCAHGVWGASQGRVIGDFGHTAIFSLSKIFQMTYAGALKINDPQLLPLIMEILDQKVSFKNRLSSWQGERTYLRFYNSPLEKRCDPDLETDLLKWYAALLGYPQLATVRGKLPRTQEEFRDVFGLQNQHFLSLLKNSKHQEFMLPQDEPGAMAPLCFPIVSDDEEFLKKVNTWLIQRNFFTGIYHFDVNRCMFGPHYKKCVPVPLYASLPNDLYEGFIQEFKGRF